MTIVEEATQLGVNSITDALVYQTKLVPVFEAILAKDKLNLEQAETLIAQTETIPHYKDVLRIALKLELPPEDKEEIQALVKEVVSFRLQKDRPDEAAIMENRYKLPVFVIMDNETKFPKLRERLIGSLGLPEEK